MNHLEAAFVYNFARFVEWPPSKFPAPASPLVIGILGRDPFGADLDEALSARPVQGHRITIRRLTGLRDIRECHVLYVNLPDGTQLAQVFREASRASALTVGQSAEFARAGGVIGLVPEADRIRLVVNRDAEARAGLKLSSKLLGLSTVIRDGGR